MSYTKIEFDEEENAKLRREIKSLKEQLEESSRAARYRLKNDENLIEKLKEQIKNVEEEYQSKQEKLEKAEETIKDMKKKFDFEEKQNALIRSSEAKVRRIRSLKNHEIEVITTQFKRKSAELHLLRGELEEIKMENDILIGFYEGEKKVLEMKMKIV